MQKLTLRVALAALLVSFTAPCGAVAKQIDLAVVVTKADAEAALGQPVKEPQPRNSDEGDGSYSRCNYYSEAGGRSLVIRVHQANDTKIDAKKQFEMLSAGTGKIESLSGLGDRAGYFNGANAPNASRILMLYVAKGNAFITIGVGGLEDQKDALEKAKGIARKVLASL